MLVKTEGLSWNLQEMAALASQMQQQLTIKTRCGSHRAATCLLLSNSWNTFTLHAPGKLSFLNIERTAGKQMCTFAGGTSFGGTKPASEARRLSLGCFITAAVAPGRQPSKKDRP